MSASTLSMVSACEFAEIGDYYIKKVTQPVCETHRLPLFKRCVLGGGHDKFTKNCFEHLKPEDLPAAAIDQNVRVALYNICIKQNPARNSDFGLSGLGSNPTDVQVKCCDHLAAGEACLVNAERCGCKKSSSAAQQNTSTNKTYVSVAIDFHCSTATGFRGHVNQVAWSTASCGDAEKALLKLNADGICSQLGQAYKFTSRKKIRTDTCS